MLRLRIVIENSMSCFRDFITSGSANDDQLGSYARFKHFLGQAACFESVQSGAQSSSRSHKKFVLKTQVSLTENLLLAFEHTNQTL